MHIAFIIHTLTLTSLYHKNSPQTKVMKVRVGPFFLLFLWIPNKSEVHWKHDKSTQLLKSGAQQYNTVTYIDPYISPACTTFLHLFTYWWTTCAWGLNSRGSGQCVIVMIYAYTPVAHGHGTLYLITRIQVQFYFHLPQTTNGTLVSSKTKRSLWYGWWWSSMCPGWFYYFHVLNFKYRYPVNISDLVTLIKGYGVQFPAVTIHKSPW